MRTWGRVPSGNNPVNTADPSTYVWVEVSTDANGYNDAVWLTTLSQVLQLGLGESPIFGNYGIPAQQSVVTQILPDYYVTLTQQLFSQYFLALLLAKIASLPPTYDINVTANPGAILMNPMPI